MQLLPFYQESRLRKKPLVHGAQPLLVMCVGRADVHD